MVRGPDSRGKERSEIVDFRRRSRRRTGRDIVVVSRSKYGFDGRLDLHLKLLYVGRGDLTRAPTGRRRESGQVSLDRQWARG